MTTRTESIKDDMKQALWEFERSSGFYFANFESGPVMLADFNEATETWQTVVPLAEVINRL